MVNTYIVYLNTILINWNRFLYYFRPILFTFCIIGNILDVILLSRRRFRTISCCTYFLVAEIIVMIQFGINFGFVFYGYNRVGPVNSIITVCKIFMYVQQSAAMMQRWLMSVATFDRFACSSSRVDLRCLATVKVARRVTLFIVVIWLIIPIYRAYFADIKQNTCDINSNGIIGLIHAVYTAVSGVVIPVSVMIPSFILIAKNLAYRRQRHHRNTVHQKAETIKRQAMERKRDQQVLAILLVQVIAYIILITPLMIMQIYTTATVTISNKPTDRLIIEQLISSITITIAIVYAAVPFYLNTMTSRMFRNELRIVIRNIVYCKWLSKRNRVQPIVIHVTVRVPTRVYHFTHAPDPKTLVPHGTRVESMSELRSEQTSTHQNIKQ